MTVIKSIATFVRTNFIAGLFIAVPFAITIAFLAWIWGRIQEPLRGIFKIAAGPSDTPWSDIFTAIQTSNYGKLFIPLISLVLLLVSILLLGILMRSIIGRVLLLSVENVVGRLPVIGMIYMSLKQLGEAFMPADGKPKFQRAVAVQFPCRGSWSLGFVTGEGDLFAKMAKTSHPSRSPDQKFLTVFVPTAPLPTAGFIIVTPEEETIELAISVQDALKVVVSGGILNPTDKPKTVTQLTQIMQSPTEARS